ERRVLHAERIENPLLEKPIEGQPGGDLDDAAKRLDAGERTVPPLGPRLEVERHGAELRNVMRQMIASLARRDPGAFPRPDAAALQPGGVRHQVPNRALTHGGAGLAFRLPQTLAERRRSRRPGLAHRDPRLLAR